MTLDSKTLKQMDGRGLFDDSYKIDGITEGECRSIFLDWAIGIPAGQEPKPWLVQIYAHYQPQFPDHPMTNVLKESLGQAEHTGRRGARAGRVIEGREG